MRMVRIHHAPLSPYMKGYKLMPGTRDVAEKVTKGELGEYLASGLFRRVYRVGDLVYKVGYKYETTASDNEIDFAIFNHFKEEEWSSEVSLFSFGSTDVLCMPFYEPSSTYDYYSPLFRSLVHTIGDEIVGFYSDHPEWEKFTPDLHEDNVLQTPEGIIKVLDAAGT